MSPAPAPVAGGGGGRPARAGAWAARAASARFTALVLDTSGQPLPGPGGGSAGRLQQTFSTRKRIVGGFYAYDNRRETQRPRRAVQRQDRRAAACSPATPTLEHGRRGRAARRARDDAGRGAQAASTVWVTRRASWWFAQDNDDRIDLLPEKRALRARRDRAPAGAHAVPPGHRAGDGRARRRDRRARGHAARRRPGDRCLKIEPTAWAPNVYVERAGAARPRCARCRGSRSSPGAGASRRVVARLPLRGPRVPRADRAGRPGASPPSSSAWPQLAGRPGRAPAGREGDAREGAVRRARDGEGDACEVRARRQAGCAGAEIAFAAVDEGLLALQRQPLLGPARRDDARRAPGAWRPPPRRARSSAGATTAARRCRPAAAAAATRRASCSTRCCCGSRACALDAKGEARIDVPLNDSLTSFRLVAIADAGAERFGSGSASVRVTQDLQLLVRPAAAGARGRPLRRELTLRNTTARAMKVRATLAGTATAAVRRSAHAAEPAAAERDAGRRRSAGAAAGRCEVPAERRAHRLGGRGRRSSGGAARRTALKVVAARRARRCRCACCRRRCSRSTARSRCRSRAPADALPARGVKRGGSRCAAAAARRRAARPAPLLRDLSLHLPGAEGLAGDRPARRGAVDERCATSCRPTSTATAWPRYFPPRAGDARARQRPPHRLPAGRRARGRLRAAAGQRASACSRGLAAFVEGRIERRFWSPRADLDVRKLAAIEALSRHGRAQPRMLGSIELTPACWPTSALIDWLGHPAARRRRAGARASALAEVQQILRARLDLRRHDAALHHRGSDDSGGG